MIWLYRLLALPALFLLPFVVLLVPRHFRRTFRRGNIRRGFSQRLGAAPRLGAPPAGVTRIWIHAVSVGEMLGIGPLVDRLTEWGNAEIYLTTTTTTGRDVALERFGGKVRGIGYFPLDFWPFAAWAWRRIHPTLAVIMERELWLEHFHQAQKRGVPVVMVNARMSDRSFARFQRFPGFVSACLRRVTRILASSPADADRFSSLGYPAERLSVSGNLKLDAEIAPRLDADERRALRAELGLGDGFVLMGSSTWPGEEAALVSALRTLRESRPDCRLLLVPRHCERRADVAALLNQSGFTWHMRSKGAAPGPVDVALADTTGEMVRLLQTADLVFVGRSLAPNDGGQTPIEAAALGRPVLFGPAMSNFRQIAAQLEEAGAAVVVRDEADLIQQVARLSRDARARESMGNAGRAWHARNRGSVDRTLAAIREVVDRRSGVDQRA